MRRAPSPSLHGGSGADRAPSPWVPLRWSLVALVAVSVVSVAGFMFVERWSFVDSVNMTLMMLTTVGFGEVRELDASGKILATASMAARVGIVLVTFGLAARAVGEGGLGEVSRRRRMQRRIDDFKDHFIICA